MEEITLDEFVERQEAAGVAHFVLLQRLFAAVADTQTDPQAWLQAQRHHAFDELAATNPADGFPEDAWARMQESAQKYIDVILLAASEAPSPER